MKVSFYKVSKVLDAKQSSYLGNLDVLTTEDVNIDIANISSISILLLNTFGNYNYIGVEIKPGVHYYYILNTWVYYGSDRAHFKYDLDIIRTLKELKGLSHDVNITQYSGELDMSPNQKIYFWKNQGNKLGANIYNSYKDLSIKYSDLPEVQEQWAGTKWLYLWLQPRPTQTETHDTITVDYNYKFNVKRINAIDKNLTGILGSGNINRIAIDNTYINALYMSPDNIEYVFEDPWYSSSENFFHNGTFEVGKIYRDTSTGFYYKYTSILHKVKILGIREFVPGPDNWVYYSRNQNYNFVGRRFVRVDPNVYKSNIEYYLNLNPVMSEQLSFNAYCIALPLNKDISVRRRISNRETAVDEVYELGDWLNIDLLQEVLDINNPNNTWASYILDMKISLAPPVDYVPYGNIRSDNPRVVYKYEDNKFIFEIVNCDLDNIMSTIKQDLKIIDTDSATVINNIKVFLPHLITKHSKLLPIETDFNLPELNKDNIIFKKFLLSTVEQRVELDIPLLIADNANKLYYYDDVGPGRNNSIIGFAPQLLSHKDTVYYLLHSPSALIITRDTSLPYFTAAYQSYLANNKNFIAQAEFQRQTQLAQSLIQNGAAMIGAGAVGITINSYNPAAAIAGSAAGMVNALITQGAQKKNMLWGIENMKSAPGNYKAAVSTLSMMLSLEVFNNWVEIYDSNAYDKYIFEQLVDDIGYQYLDFPYRLDAVINHATEEVGKKFLQCVLTGITFDANVDPGLLNILKIKLEGGIHIFNGFDKR